MKFFNIIDGEIELAKDEIRLYPNIAKILSRDKGGKIIGDPDGRRKFYAFNEFKYIYFSCDFEAYPAQNGLSEKETHEYALKQCSGLSKEYKPDDVVIALMKQYTKEHLSPSKHAIKTLIRLFTLNDKVVAKIEKNLTDTLDLPTLNREQIREVLEYQQKLIDIATAIPRQAKQLKEAMNLLEEEEKNKEFIRGGEEKLSSMEPGNEIEK